MDAGRFALCTLSLLLLPGLVTCGKLLMFLIDGFRWDYTHVHGPLDRLTGFKRVIDSGVKAEYLQPAFPTESMTNYYALATGLYPESNGMIANRIYDRERDAYLNQFELPNLRWTFWWDEAEPIWITAEKHNKPAHMYYWEGCEIELQGIKTSFCIPYEEPPWANITESVRTGIRSLKDNSAQLLGVYIPHVDNLGHDHGPLSTEVRQAVREMDVIINFALDELQSQGMDDDVDVMFFSDHGQVDTSTERMINITGLFDTADIDAMISDDPNVAVWPKPDKVGKVYNALRDVHPNVTAYLKANLPERWHVKNHHRTPDLWLIADLGWSIVYNALEIGLGSHGYDNVEPEMQGIFMASGPHFQNDLKTGPISVVDVYQLMCYVLGLEPLANNGTWSKVQPMLRDVTSGGMANACDRTALMVCCCLVVWAVSSSSGTMD